MMDNDLISPPEFLQPASIIVQTADYREFENLSNMEYKTADTNSQ